MKQTKRLLSLDILRGITIAGMILVNNSGSGKFTFAPLHHADWNGLTPTDLVFPFFMFIMGVSAYFSLKKYEFKATGDAVWKIIKRSVVILLIGWALSWFSRFLGRIYNPDYDLYQSLINFDSMRTLGVLPRLALCYCVASLLAVTVDHKWLKWIIAGSLIAYAVILLVGKGYEFSENNIIAIVDRAVLGEDHMYTSRMGDLTMKFDPEGLLSTLPSIAHCLIGFLCGGMISAVHDNEKRSYNLFIIGAILTMAGFLLSYGLPINKKVWSPTFVLTTCGLAASLFALLIWIIDIKGKKNWCKFFEVFGINPLALYVLSGILAVIFGSIRIPMASAENGFVNIHSLIYQYFLVPVCVDKYIASLAYAILFVLLNWCVGLILYKKKIYIKI